MTRRAAVAVLALALASAAWAAETAVALEPPAAASPVREGTASWYGAAFHGRRTASGERFDMHDFTAAHPTLPFGTVVEVRSLVNGRAVRVRINDRGPFTGRRVIDLSHAAAQALGLLGRGTKRVRIRPLAPHELEPPAVEPAEPITLEPGARAGQADAVDGH
ncbi:MAG: septal ring lytic transglycosylase RlpA family protein [Pseudomonadota bacterium]